MITLRIDSDYDGPTILELGELLDQGGPIDIAWQNTKAEIQVLSHYRTREVQIFVKDLAAMERVASGIGAAYSMPSEVVTRAFQCVAKGNGLWRDFNSQVGQGVSKAALSKIVNDNILNGHDSPVLRKVLVDCLFEGISSADIDVLVGLRSTGVTI